jgi:hypothetical protein
MCAVTSCKDATTVNERWRWAGSGYGYKAKLLASAGKLKQSTIGRRVANEQAQVQRQKRVAYTTRFAVCC